MNYVLTENAVGKIRRAIAPSAGNTGAVGAIGRPIDPDTFPAPFTVRWSASANSGAGAWVIWLPDRAKLVMYGGTFIGTITGVAAATVLPTGWYTITGAQATTTTAYLVITVTDSTGVATAEISTTAGQSVTGTTVYNILVASMASVAATGAKSVKQFVDSVVTLGSGGGGGVVPDDISTEFIPDPPAGTQPDGDEGKLQIKGFKAGAPADQNTVTDYLQGVVNIPNGGISLVCRTIDTNQARQIIYIPLAALFSSSSIAANVSFTKVGDIQWNPSTHTLQKRLDTVNLKTGAVTQGNWSDITNGNTTPISSII